MKKRVFLIILDSFGIGEAPDAKEFGDEGSNTLATIVKSKYYNTPNLEKLGLFNIDGVVCKPSINAPIGSFGRLEELSQGKDTTVGHWEIAGVSSEWPLPTYPNGFPDYIIQEFEEKTGRKVLCNKPYSGTELLDDYGEEHMKTGALLVYTSADSVFQIAAHEEIVPIEELYKYCQIARDMLQGKDGVGRVIARPFVGTGKGNFKRTANRHDFSLKPPRKTVLDFLQEKGFDTISVGKIYDIFDGEGIDTSYKTASNKEGMEVTIELAKKDFNGLCFVNLVEFDSTYGHRNDIDGYANAMTEFDTQLGELLPLLKEDDILMITADHGCDPGTSSTDHSREYTPFLVYGEHIKQGVNLGTKKSFGCVAKTIADYFEVPTENLDGENLLSKIQK